MKKKAAAKSRKQEVVPRAMSATLQQLMLPMMIASEAIKNRLLAFVQQVGLLAFRELLSAEAAAIAGPKGKHVEPRTHHHWGTTPTTLPFGGRHVVVERPRVRRKGKGGKEVELPSVEAARQADPMPAHVAEKIVAGVSTRNYRRSLDPVDESLETRGESKSNVSRALVERTADKLADFLDRKLDDIALAVAFLDMNGLKQIKDTYGHGPGDEAIRAFFQAVTSTLGQRGEVYRNGGDEVVALLPSTDEAAMAKLFAALVQELGKEKLRLSDGRELPEPLTCSCGAVVTTDPREDAKALHDRADHVQYKAKAASKQGPRRLGAYVVGEGEVVTVLPA